MTKNNTDIVRQLLIDVLATHTAEINGKFELIKQELGQIKEQTIKTNGRVNKHDEQLIQIALSEQNHILKCPHTDSVAEFKTIKKYWKVFGIAAIVVASITIFGAYSTYSTFRKTIANEKILINAKP